MRRLKKETDASAAIDFHLSNQNTELIVDFAGMSVRLRERGRKYHLLIHYKTVEEKQNITDSPTSLFKQEESESGNIRTK